MEKYAAIDRAAKLSIIFSAVYIVGALIINLAPLRIVQLTVPVDPNDVTVTIPVSVYVLSVYFSLNILAAVLVMKRRGIYAPLVISAVSPVLVYAVNNIASVIEQIMVSMNGKISLAVYGAISTVSSMLNIVSRIGAVMCIALSAAYACIRRKESSEAYMPPVKGWSMAAIVMLSVYILAAVLIIACQKAVMYSPTLFDGYSGFAVPAGYIVHILTAAALIVCCFRFMKNGTTLYAKVSFWIAALFPIAAYIAVLSENKLLAGAGVKEFVYNTQLYSFDGYISFLCFGGAAICAAVSAAKAASLSDEIMKGIESNEVL